ncbi:MAG: methionyl-tRNA formyltransferase [Patescibacteria group bacterium]
MPLNTKYIFFGTPEFAAIILEKLIDAGYIPEAVVCNPDKPVGRKKIITPPPAKQRILNLESGIKNKIKIFQPEKLDSSIKYQVSSIKPDFFIVAAYSKILPKEIIEIPRLGTIGVHPSLLPKHRGTTPIQTTILNGDEITGTTIFLIDEKMDHGKIVSSIKCLVSSNDNYGILMKKLAELSADLLIETLSKFIKGEIKPQPQDESQATYTKKFKIEDAFIKPEDLKKAQTVGGEIASSIERKIRALNPEPGVFTIINDKRIKFLESKIQDNKLKLIKIQKQGEKPQALTGNLNSHV